MSDAPAWLSELAAGSLDEVNEVEGEPLKVPSGRIVACDPLVFLDGADAFLREVPPGEHRVVVGVLDLMDNAYAAVRFSDAPIVKWEVARCAGEEEVEGWPGYGVDAGIGCFADAKAQAAFVAEEEKLRMEVSSKVVEQGVDPADADAWDEAVQRVRAEMEWEDPLLPIIGGLGGPDKTVSVPLTDEGNLVAFTSGAGDGVYASFWGLDAAGAPVALVTDFGLFGDDDEDDDDDEDLEQELAELDDELGELEEELGELGAGGLDKLAAVLGLVPKEPEPAPEQESPLFRQSRDLLESWVKNEKIELEPDANLDAFAEALLEKLVSLSGHRNPGAHVGEWLLERDEVADVFASDDDLERDLVR